MRSWFDPQSWNTAALAQAWRSARPFPHVVLDRLLSDEALGEVRRAFAAEPHWPDRGTFLYDFMGSAEPPVHPVLQDLCAWFGSEETRAAVSAITGKALGKVDMRGYCYLEGNYLLAHTDHRAQLGRLVAYALYLAHPGTVCGGELELFATTLDASGEIVATEPAGRIAPLPNRLVLFDVSPTSLHQVCEVVEGVRLSLSGWYYPGNPS